MLGPMSHRWAHLGLLLLLAALTGCVNTVKAQQYASLLSDCPSKNIEEVSQDGHDAILDVCGVHERWRWHAFDGWGYAGPADSQPPPAVPTAADSDGDGILDTADACPTLVGVASIDPKKNGCPPPTDADADGIVDGLDACPQVPGVANEDPKKNGCPLPGDADGDGITDDVDACPQKAGVASTDPTKNGCPDDNDGDGILNEVDACPDEAGKADEDPKKNGCPMVQVKGDQIVINERIEFATGKATIKAVSNDLLDAIAKVMTDHPEIKKVEIQGHTDNKGSKYLNTRLSDRRAKAVVDALTTRGIDAGRMTSKGFGADKPIATNDTPEGRQTNRRVQFLILEQDAPKPKTIQKSGAAAPPAPATEP